MWCPSETTYDWYNLHTQVSYSAHACLDISIRNLTSAWHFHKYATPWQLCYNRDKENLFHFTCSWKTSGKKHKLNEMKCNALRWIGISCSDSKKERKNFYRRIFLCDYPHPHQGAVPGEFLLFSYPRMELWRSSLMFRFFVYRYTRTQPTPAYRVLFK